MITVNCISMANMLLLPLNICESIPLLHKNSHWSEFLIAIEVKISTEAGDNKSVFEKD